LLAGTVNAACLLATGQAAAAGAASAGVATLMEEVLKTMLVHKLKIVTAAVTVAALACCGLAALTREAAGQTAPAPQTREARPSLARAAADRESLQGAWAVVSVESDGKVDVGEKAFFLVMGNRASWQTPEGDMEGGLYLDPTSRPKAYDLATSKRTLEGIYELKCDTLRLCYDPSWESKRPRQFATGPGGRDVLLVLKRLSGDTRDFRLADGSKAFPLLIDRPVRPQPPPRVAQAPGQVAPPPRTDQVPPSYGPGLKGKKAPARVGEVIIVGNTKTPDAVIRKHIGLFPGQVLDYASFGKAEKALADLKRFVVDPAKGIRPTVVVVEPDDANAPFKDILVTVAELPAGQTSLRREVRSLVQALEQLQQRLSEVQDEAGRKTLQRQADALREGLERLEQNLPKTEGRSANPGNPPLGSALNSDAGLAGKIVLNERNFDALRAIGLNQAEKDFQVAEFYRKTGHAGSATYYYELVRRRYPGTPFAAQAQQRLRDLRSDPAD
jgi:uncharacterized protein (TIGR03067 family)